MPKKIKKKVSWLCVTASRRFCLNIEFTLNIPCAHCFCQTFFCDLCKFLQETQNLLLSPARYLPIGKYRVALRHFTCTIGANIDLHFYPLFCHAFSASWSTLPLPFGVKSIVSPLETKPKSDLLCGKVEELLSDCLLK